MPDLARSLDIDERVHFLGFRRDIADLMRAADFFVLPSRRDSCPLVLLEALASGLPAIVTDNVGTADLVADKAGFVMEAPDNHARLAKYMNTLTRKPDTRRSLGHAARCVAKKHSWERMATQYLQVLQNLAGQRTPTDRPSTAP
jgi:glycosyltransferase involved in cell wall biosynthesis